MTEKLWECFLDESYYHMFCVMNKKHRGFDDSIHVKTKEEAEYIRDKFNMHTELVEALEDVLLQFDSCTIRQDNLKTKIRNLINKATKESDNAK